MLVLHPYGNLAEGVSAVFQAEFAGNSFEPAEGFSWPCVVLPMARRPDPMDGQIPRRLLR